MLLGGLASPLQVTFRSQLGRRADPVVIAGADRVAALRGQRLIRDLDVAATSLDELRTAGVGIAIDDFGTGFSSLSWLERLPLDVLKIDRSFINGLGASHDDTIIVRSVIAMAHNLKLKVVAEGIESISLNPDTVVDTWNRIAAA